MSRLTEIMRLAEEASKRTPGEWGKGEGYYGYIGPEDGRYVCFLHNNIKQMVELIRMQHEALKGWGLFNAVDTWKEALAAFERFDKGEG